MLKHQRICMQMWEEKNFLIYIKNEEKDSQCFLLIRLHKKNNDLKKISNFYEGIF